MVFTYSLVNGGLPETKRNISNYHTMLMGRITCLYIFHQVGASTPSSRCSCAEISQRLSICRGYHTSLQVVYIIRMWMVWLFNSSLGRVRQTLRRWRPFWSTTTRHPRRLVQEHNSGRELGCGANGSNIHVDCLLVWPRMSPPTSTCLYSIEQIYKSIPTLALRLFFV